MLNILNMIVLINNKVTGHVQELNIKCTTGNLIILAEVVICNPQTKENVTGFYAIESITTVKKKTYIKDHDKIMGMTLSLKVVKNKLAIPFKEIELPIYFK